MKNKQLHYNPGKANTLMGQRFLTSQNIVESIINAAEITKKDTVLEVGPGRGVLTEQLASLAKRVIAVEKDGELAELLRAKYAGKKNIEIITGDILQVDLSRQLPKKYKIVANLPYYITSHFLRIFLESKLQPTLMVLMVQWEVARRITVRPPNMNMLALSVQAYGAPQIIQKVPRSFFKPRPDVDSAIIRISNISNYFFVKNKISPDKFFALARKAFSQKRKTLRNSIGTPPASGSKKRPQELALKEWVEFTRHRISSKLL